MSSREAPPDTTTFKPRNRIPRDVIEAAQTEFGVKVRFVKGICHVSGASPENREKAVERLKSCPSRPNRGKDPRFNYTADPLPADRAASQPERPTPAPAPTRQPSAPAPAPAHQPSAPAATPAPTPVFAPARSEVNREELTLKRRRAPRDRRPIFSVINSDRRPTDGHKRAFRAQTDSSQRAPVQRPSRYPQKDRSDRALPVHTVSQPVPPVVIPPPQSTVSAQPLPDDVIEKLRMMNGAVQYGMTAEDVRGLIHPTAFRLLSDYSDSPLLPQGEPQELTNVPAFLGKMFIEAFGCNQLQKTRFMEEKPYPNGHIMELALPTRVPVEIVTETPEKIRFGFFNTNTISAKEVDDLVDALLKVVSRRELFVAEFKHIDNELLSAEEFDRITKNLRVAMLVSYGATDEETQSTDVSLKVMKVDWTPEFEQKVRNEFTQLFQKCALYNCKQCEMLFNPNDNASCQEFYHPGEQIELEPGVWDAVEIDEETGEPITIVKFTCCGECEEGQGCTARDIGPHVAGSPFSAIEFSTQPIYTR